MAVALEDARHGLHDDRQTAAIGVGRSEQGDVQLFHRTNIERKIENDDGAERLPGIFGGGDPKYGIRMRRKIVPS